MSAAAGLAPGQIRAVGLTIGAVYGFSALRGILVDLQLDAFDLAQARVSAIAWLPGVVALVAFIAKRVRAGQLWLPTAGFAYPIAVLLWPLVAVPGDEARNDFWIHQIPGLAAVALLLTVRVWIATICLIVYDLLVEVVMRTTGIITEWSVTLVRAVFSLVYSAFFFILLLALLRTMEATNRMLDRSAREQAQASILQARSEEIVRLDRLTHDVVLSLLSSAAKGVPADKLQLQADLVRRELESGFAESEADSTVAEVADRIARRSGRRGVPVTVRGTAGRKAIPREAAAEVEAAVDEGLRNAIAHATDGQRVEMRVDEGSLLVRIADDGPGFEADRLAERLGVRQSILERMNSLPGGGASVDSRPGRGTVVTISWSAS